MINYKIKYNLNYKSKICILYQVVQVQVTNPKHCLHARRQGDSRGVVEPRPLKKVQKRSTLKKMWTFLGLGPFNVYIILKNLDLFCTIWTFPLPFLVVLIRLKRFMLSKRSTFPILKRPLKKRSYGHDTIFIEHTKSLIYTLILEMAKLYIRISAQKQCDSGRYNTRLYPRGRFH